MSCTMQNSSPDSTGNSEPSSAESSTASESSAEKTAADDGLPTSMPVISIETVNQDPDVFWPSEIMIGDPVVEVRYSGGTQKTLAYSKETGAPWNEGTAEALVLAELTDGNDAYYRFTSARSAETLNVLFTPVEDVRNFQILDLDLIFGETEAYTARVLCTLPILRPDTPMLVTMSFDGATPVNGFAYTDRNGVRSCWALDLSGEDGSLLTWEIQTQ